MFVPYKIITALATSALLSIPLVTWAVQDPPANFGGIGSAVAGIINFINGVLIPIVIGLSVLVFFWGLFQYFIAGGGDEEARSKGRQLMLYGIIDFFLFATIFAIIALLVEGVGLGGGGVFDDPGNRPEVPFGGDPATQNPPPDTD